MHNWRWHSGNVLVCTFGKLGLITLWGTKITNILYLSADKKVSLSLYLKLSIKGEIKLFE